MTRSTPVGGERLRNVDPIKELGIPIDRVIDLVGNTDAVSTVDSARVTKDAAGLVAFYAAQSLERTPEMYLPTRAPNSLIHGLFTYNLVQVLARNADISYRQAGQQVLLNYVIQNRLRPTPIFEGTRLDAPVFGTANKAHLQQWPLRRVGSRLEIYAGQLHLLESGTVLSILPNPTSTDQEALGYVEVSKPEMTRSLVKSIAYTNSSSLDVEAIPIGAYARLVEPKFNFDLRIALPNATTESALLARKILKNLAEKEQWRNRLVIVEPKQEADVYAVIHDGNLLLLPASIENIDNWSGPSIDLRSDAAEAHTVILRSLSRIAKVLNLLRLSRQIPAAQLPVRLSVSLQRKGSADVEPMPTHKVAELYDGDTLTFRIDNLGHRPVDVTMLFVDSAYRLSLIYPRQFGELNRIEPFGNDTVRGVVDASKSIGRENLLMLAVAAETSVTPTDFSFLVHDIPLTNETERSSYSAFSSLLRKASLYDQDTRGFAHANADELQDASMALISWRTER